MAELKLGKKPFVASEHDFRLAWVTHEQDTFRPPYKFGHGLAYQDWLMLGNDDYGDCVFAGAAHETMLTNRLASKIVTFDDDSVLSDYSAVTGFDPNDPSTDQGAEVRDVLSYRRKTGIIDANGNRHKIGAYVSIDPTNWDELMFAVYYFTCVGIGFEFPDSAFEQFDHHLPWDVVEGATVEGGHYVPVMGRNALSTGGCVSWGRRVGFTKDFYETYNDESWAIVFPEELKNGKTERGLDITELNNLLAELN